MATKVQKKTKSKTRVQSKSRNRKAAGKIKRLVKPKPLGQGQNLRQKAKPCDKAGGKAERKQLKTKSKACGF